MAFKELKWLTQLQEAGSIYQCGFCLQNHDLHCQRQESVPNPTAEQARPAPDHRVSPIIRPIPSPASWLPTCIRPKKEDPADDIEANAESPDESTPLITPCTEHTATARSSGQDSDESEHLSDHEEGEGAKVKKRGNRKGKNGGEGKRRKLEGCNDRSVGSSEGVRRPIALIST